MSRIDSWMHGAALGIKFASCNTQYPWEASVLLSPKAKITSDTLLLFQVNTPHRGSLDIYTWSEVGHPLARIAEFPVSGTDVYNETVYNMTQDSGNDPSPSTMTFAAQTVCIPRSSEKIAFIASGMYVSSIVATQPDVVVKDVVFTGSPCTAETRPGNVLYLYCRSRTTRRCFVHSL